MKGIILAGGFGSRLNPVTKTLNKHLLLLYDKPVIYYSISILLQSGIRDILIISSEDALPMFKKMFDDGSQLGVSISYAAQDYPKGIAEALIIGEDFIGEEDICLVLGDNVLYGKDLAKLSHCTERTGGATIFACYVENPSAFGVIEMDDNGNALSIEEKPQNAKSNYAVPGIYFYDNRAIDYAKQLTPSSRGEIEISEINNIYLNNKELFVETFDQETMWFDTGTPDGLLKAAEFIEHTQHNEGQYIGCIEEIAWRKGYIDDRQLRSLAKKFEPAKYGQYLSAILTN